MDQLTREQLAPCVADRAGYVGVALGDDRSGLVAEARLDLLAMRMPEVFQKG